MANLKESSFIISYMVLRKAIGLIGITLPFVLVLGTIFGSKSENILPSISEYYFSVMGDYFVGALCAIGLFLFAYKGPERIDNILGNIAGIFAFGVAFLPMFNEKIHDGCFHILNTNELVGKFHFISAASLFIILALFSLWLFTKTEKKCKKTKQKKIRNGIYITCGIVMLLSLLIIALLKLMPVTEVGNLVFWMETTALVAFGISWLIKGEFILEDDDALKSRDERKKKYWYSR